MPTKTFTNITPAQMASFRVQLVEQGIAAQFGNTGAIDDIKHGVTIGFSYDGTANLTLTLESKPWWMGADMVWDALTPYLAPA